MTVSADSLLPGLVGTNATLPRAIITNQLVPHPFHDEVIFISVDIESFERNHSIITEIGISTLDTRDLQTHAPGPKGESWFCHIRARHFRIREYMHLVNTDFVSGCPDKFEFGSSEIINKSDAPAMIASCFREPYSRSTSTGGVTDDASDSEKRKLVLLGHDAGQDVAYLRQLGYDISNLSNMVEVLDTAMMHCTLKREPNSRSLGHVLYEMDLMGWNLHNAGNDAAYTMQAMLAICFKDAESWTKDKAEVVEENHRRTEERIEAAKGFAEERARNDAEGWSADEHDDGGVAIGAAEAHVANSGPKTFVAKRQGDAAGGSERVSEQGLADKMGGVSLQQKHLLDD